MGNPGKNKLLRYARLYYDGYELSGDSRNVGSLDRTFAEIDMVGWSQTIHNYLTDGYLNRGIVDYVAYLNDDTTGAYTALKDNIGENHIVSMLLGGNAEPTYGDPAYMLSGVQTYETAGQEGGALTISASFLPMGSVTYQAGTPWGIVLYPSTSISATTNGTSQDQLAASTAGWEAAVHITASVAGNFSFKIEHSTDNSSWSTLYTFTLNGSAVAAEYGSATGTVNRYVRFVSTRTGGTCTPMCVFIRK